jgi:hypothetical protein
MVQTSAQFTPAQLLDSGRRAESEGKLDLAAQFYRHLTEHHAYSAEAAEARNGLGRVGAAQSQIWQSPKANGAHLNGGAHADAAHRARPTRPARRRPTAPRDDYRAGRAMARVLSAVGWLTAAAGFVVPALHFLPLGPMPGLGLVTLAAVATGTAITGFLVVFAGQIARALFDQANATRDLAALERAKFGNE